MKIVIPTYNRYNDFKTLKLLEGYEDQTYIFLVQEEEQLYKDAIGDKFKNIIVAPSGRVKLAIFLETPARLVTQSRVTGRVADEDAVENAVSRAGANA